MPVTPVTAIPQDFARSGQEQVARVRERQQAAAPTLRPPTERQAGGRDESARAQAQDDAERPQAERDAARLDAQRFDVQRGAARTEQARFDELRDSQRVGAARLESRQVGRIRDEGARTQRADEQAREQEDARIQTDEERAFAERAAQAYRTESQRAETATAFAQQEAAEPLNAQLQVARDRLEALDAVRIDRVDVSNNALTRIAY